MTDSPIVHGLKEGTLAVVYEDEDVVVFLDPAPVSPGHMVVAPKQPYSIMEEVPDWLIGKLGEVANKASTAAFEALAAKGTNILITNGIPAGQELNHFCINVIPRFDSDGLDFSWKPKQLNEEEMSTVELLLKERAASLGAFESKKEEQAPRPEEAVEEPAGPPPAEGENFMLRQLDRIP